MMAKQQLDADLAEALRFERECEARLERAKKDLEVASANRRAAETAKKRYRDPRYLNFGLEDWTAELNNLKQNKPRRTDLPENDIIEHWQKTLFDGYTPNIIIRNWVDLKYTHSSPECQFLIKSRYPSYFRN